MATTTQGQVDAPSMVLIYLLFHMYVFHFIGVFRRRTSLMYVIFFSFAQTPAGYMKVLYRLCIL